MNWKKTLNGKYKYIITGMFIGISLICTSIAKSINPTLNKKPIPAFITNTDTGINPILLLTAKTPQERSRGLMFVGSLPSNYGMLFIFPEEAVHTFWMYNTFIPLDIIFLNSDNKVVHIVKNIQAHDISTVIGDEILSKYAIELSAGTVDKLGIRINSVALFKTN